MDREYERRLKARYGEFRQAARESLLGVSCAGSGRSALDVTAEERRGIYQARWDEGGGMPLLLAFTDLLVDQEANDTVAEFLRGKIREAVEDPAVADLLCPSGFPVGAKRLCQHSEYFEVYNRDNVTLVDVRSAPIVEITPAGVRTRDAEVALDTIVLATGFDALTGALLAIDIRGAGGLALADTWAAGPRTYLGIATAGFPNLFVVAGPGSPSVLSNVVLSIEQHVEWIGEVASQTLFPLADSWYVGANIPGKPRVFLPYVGGVGAYRQRCDEVAANGYEGFRLTGRRAAAGSASTR
jgi:cyclohexanone monooxygenase